MQAHHAVRLPAYIAGHPCLNLCPHTRAHPSGCMRPCRSVGGPSLQNSGAIRPATARLQSLAAALASSTSSPTAALRALGLESPERRSSGDDAQLVDCAPGSVFGEAGAPSGGLMGGVSSGAAGALVAPAHQRRRSTGEMGPLESSSSGLTAPDEDGMSTRRATSDDGRGGPPHSLAGSGSGSQAGVAWLAAAGGSLKSQRASLDGALPQLADGGPKPKRSSREIRNVLEKLQVSHGSCRWPHGQACGCGCCRLAAMRYGPRFCVCLGAAATAFHMLRRSMQRYSGGACGCTDMPTDAAGTAACSSSCAGTAGFNNSQGQIRRLEATNGELQERLILVQTALADSQVELAAADSARARAEHIAEAALARVGCGAEVVVGWGRGEGGVQAGMLWRRKCWRMCLRLRAWQVCCTASRQQPHGTVAPCRPGAVTSSWRRHTSKWMGGSRSCTGRWKLWLRRTAHCRWVYLDCASCLL